MRRRLIYSTLVALLLISGVAVTPTLASRSVASEPPQEFQADVTLPVGRKILGTVKTAAKKGVGDTTVAACLVGDEFTCESGQTTNAGAFVIDGLVPGQYLVRAYHPRDAMLAGGYFGPH